MQVKILNVVSVFMVLFAVIDILGSLPIIIDLKSRGKDIKAPKTTVVALVILTAFLFGGELILRLFGVDISSFAIAGSIVIFFLALEMVLGFELFKTEMSSDATIIPLAFPLIAGPGSITTLISLRAEYTMMEISIALVSNMVFVLIILILAEKIEKTIGKTGVYILKKFFGIILLAIAVKLFASNVNSLF